MGQVSKLLKGLLRKSLEGSRLRGFDSVKKASILGDIQARAGVPRIERSVSQMGANITDRSLQTGIVASIRMNPRSGNGGRTINHPCRFSITARKPQITLSTFLHLS